MCSLPLKYRNDMKIVPTRLNSFESGDKLSSLRILHRSPCSIDAASWASIQKRTDCYGFIQFNSCVFPCFVFQMSVYYPTYAFQFTQLSFHDSSSRYKNTFILILVTHFVLMSTSSTTDSLIWAVSKKWKALSTITDICSVLILVVLHNLDGSQCLDVPLTIHETVNVSFGAWVHRYF